MPPLNKVNIHSAPAQAWDSPKGKFGGSGIEISEELGWDPRSHDVRKRHPFAVEWLTVSPGKRPYPYHSHSAQWEYYQVISGVGSVRHEEGTDAIEPGDAFIFGPDQPHQLINDGSQDLVVLVVADNPVGESCHYPDSGKWLVRSPERRLIRSESLDYFDGEE